MTEAFVDTDVIIRLVTGDDAAKQAAAVSLFEQAEAGGITLKAPVTVIADAVYVLSSRRLYNLPRSEIQAILDRILQIRHFEVESNAVVSEALQVYVNGNLDFGDAMIVASMRLDDCPDLYSYDRDFDRLTGITRIEP